MDKYTYYDHVVSISLNEMIRCAGKHKNIVLTSVNDEDKNFMYLLNIAEITSICADKVVYLDHSWLDHQIFKHRNKTVKPIKRFTLKTNDYVIIDYRAFLNNLVCNHTIDKNYLNVFSDIYDIYYNPKYKANIDEET